MGCVPCKSKIAALESSPSGILLTTRKLLTMLCFILVFFNISVEQVPVKDYEIPLSKAEVMVEGRWLSDKIIVSLRFARRMILGWFECQFGSCTHASNLSSVGHHISVTCKRLYNLHGKDVTFDVLPSQKLSHLANGKLPYAVFSESFAIML